MATEVLFPLAGKRVWVAGHRGMVGAALVRRLAREDCDVLTVGRDAVDLRRQGETEAWISDARPDAIFLAAARVGGIAANNAFPGDFLHDNLAIQTNVIEAAYRTGVDKLVFLGSSCIYPKLAPQPIPEEALLSGPLEPTNEWYAIAKIAGLKLAQAYRRQHGCDFISAMPTNLYGPEDNFDLETSHVLPALIRKAHESKIRGLPELVIWGTGSPRREFLHVDDCADALVHLMKTYSDDIHVNVGVGEDISIADLAGLVTRVTGFAGRVVYDATRPDGTPRKLLDVGRLRSLGWAPRIGLEAGVTDTYRWFLKMLGAQQAAAQVQP
jgi:GDP-L-fucose synthase